MATVQSSTSASTNDNQELGDNNEESISKDFKERGDLSTIQPPETENEKSNEAGNVTEKGEGSSQGKSSRTTVKDCVIKMLDEMDERVEKLRSDAMKLENERDDVLSSLDTLLNAQMIYDLDGIDVDEITRYMERLARRCMTVQVDIKTERSPQQLEALHKVNNLIDSMICEMKRDAVATRRMCVAYINSCSEQLPTEIPVTDAVFEVAILGCTIEDQKRIKKRLSGLYTYFESYGRPSSLPEEMEENISQEGRSIQK